MADGVDRLEERFDRLESLVERQQATIEAQRATLDQQRERIAALEAETNTDATASDSGEAPLVGRRDALKAGGLLALLFGGVGTASADPQGQVGTSADPLQALYTAALNGPITDGGGGPQPLTKLPGDGLAIDGEELTIDPGDGLGIDGETVAVDIAGGLGFDGNGSLQVPSNAIGNDELENDTVSVGAGDGLSGGGDLSLGGTTTLDVDPGDFAGRNLTASGGDLDYDPPENVIVVAKSGGDYSDVGAALDAVSGPGVVWVAPGEYKVSGTDIPSGVTLVGASRTSTVLYNNSLLGLDLSNSCEIRSLTVEQRSDPNSTPSVINMGSGEVRIRDVTIQTMINGVCRGIESSDGTLNLQNVTVWMGNNSKDSGVALYNVALGDSTADIRNSILKGGSDSTSYALYVSPDATANVANSQIINGIGNAGGVVNQVGNYDGDYNAL
jgi:hypothetical protein